MNTENSLNQYKFKIITGHYSSYFIDLNDQIGQGGNSSIFKCYDINNYQIELCAKVINRIQLQEKLIKYEIVAFEKLKDLNNSRFIKGIDYCMSQNNVYLIMEYCNSGDLFSLLSTRKWLCEEEVQYILYELSSAFHMLHQQNIIHRDLKPENILISEFFFLKIADFGHSKHVFDINQSNLLSQQLGTPFYWAPEADFQNCKDEAHQTKEGKIDVWSLGIISYFMIYGFIESNFKYFHQQINQFKLSKGKTQLVFPPNLLISQSMQNIIKSMLNYYPEQRPSMLIIQQMVKQIIENEGEQKLLYNQDQLQNKQLNLQKNQEYMKALNLSISKMIVVEDTQLKQNLKCNQKIKDNQTNLILNYSSQEKINIFLQIKKKQQEYLSFINQIMIKISEIYFFLMHCQLYRKAVQTIQELQIQLQNSEATTINLLIFELQRIEILKKQILNLIENLKQLQQISINNERQKLIEFSANKIQQEYLLVIELIQKISSKMQMSLESIQTLNDDLLKKEIYEFLKIMKLNQQNSCITKNELKKYSVLQRFLVGCYDLSANQFLSYKQNPFFYYQDFYSSIQILLSQDNDGFSLRKHNYIQAKNSNLIEILEFIV